VLLTGLSAAYWAFGAFLPWREDSEALRLAAVGGVVPGRVVADVGAGTGRFSAAMARVVGSAGRVYATDLDADRLRDIQDRLARAGLRNATVLEGAPEETRLPDGCCDVVFMRNVYHHVRNPERFASSLARAVRPGGVLVIIDFEPGALWLHGGKPDEAGRRPGHGVSRRDAITEITTAGFTVREEVARWSGPMWLVAFERTAGQ
jgi:ubiquinone/menaquinone biosynthesis C-methylase UbiE